MIYNIILLILNIISIIFLGIQIIKIIKKGQITRKLMIYIVVIYLNIYAFIGLMHSLGV